MKKRMNNAGMTLLELIVVIAIISILLGMSTYALSFAFSKDAENCARTVDTQLANLRSQSMNKSGEYKMRITVTGDRKVEILKDEVQQEHVDIKKGVTIEFYLDDVAKDAEWVEIVFNKSKGKVSRLIFSDGEVTTLPAVFSIKITDRRGKSKEVKLVSLTGKHYVD